MKVRITKPCRVNILGGEVEVNRQEYERLLILGLVEVMGAEKEVPEKALEKETKKKKAKK